MNFRHNATYTNVRNQMPLTIDALRSLAPSAFAVSAHESRSSHYTYIPTVNVIEGMMKAGFMPFYAGQSKSRVEGKSEFTKHMIRFRREGGELAQVGDSIPEVILINSHDGSSAYHLIAGLYRKVCMNGLAVSEGTVSSLNIAHKGDIVDRVIEGSIEIIDNTAGVLETVKEWQGLALTSGEQTAYAEAAHVLRFGDAEGKAATPIQPAQLLNARRSDDAANSLWHTFNRVQENAIRGGLRGFKRDERGFRTRRVSTRPVVGIDQNVKLNRALWTLTEQMAKLKVA